MLACDRDVLHSQFTRNSLQVHSKLVHLYLANLNAIATQAAIVADLGFGSIREVEVPQSHIRGSFMFGYIYYICSMSSLMASLMALSQSTILVIYGHSLFIKGEDSDASIAAVGQMRSSQLESGFWGAVCGMFLLLQGLAFSWANVSNYRVGLVVTMVYVFGMYYVYSHGINSIHSFLALKEKINSEAAGHRPEDGRPEESDDKSKSPVKRLLNRQMSWVRQLGATAPSQAEKQQMEDRKAVMYETVRKNIRESSFRGVLWAKFHEAFNTRCFVKCYAVLERGRLDFYRSKQHFVDINNTINKKPIRLKQYSVETDPRIIDHFTPPNAFLGYSALRAATTGVTEVGVKDFYKANFDVFLATKELRITLLPVTSTEISLDEPIHMMAEDKTMFKYWTDAFSEVLGYYSELDELDAPENQKKRVYNVEEAVNLAHNRYADSQNVTIDVEPRMSGQVQPPRVGGSSGTVVNEPSRQSMASSMDFRRSGSGTVIGGF
mmetsp:Transcript_1095/g.2253  ORF Transcript_1095/g.2253 Transcript_1095/m.2253 type:complete len:493 (-) Transcript_1095:360-1838(-)